METPDATARIADLASSASDRSAAASNTPPARIEWRPLAQSGRTFLVECYLPGVVERDVAAAGERARRAAEELRNRGRVVAYLGAMFVAADEAVYHQFRAHDAAVVAEVSRLADLGFERVVESVGVGRADKTKG